MLQNNFYFISYAISLVEIYEKITLYTNNTKRCYVSWENQTNLINFKFQKAVTHTILGLGPWSKDQNDLE